MNIPLLVLVLVGLLLYGFTDNKLSEVGRILFAFAYLALCLAGSSSHWLRITW